MADGQRSDQPPTDRTSRAFEQVVEEIHQRTKIELSTVRAVVEAFVWEDRAKLEPWEERHARKLVEERPEDDLDIARDALRGLARDVQLRVDNALAAVGEPTNSGHQPEGEPSRSNIARARGLAQALKGFQDGGRLAERDDWRECAEGLAEALEDQVRHVELADRPLAHLALSRYEALRDGTDGS